MSRTKHTRRAVLSSGIAAAALTPALAEGALAAGGKPLLQPTEVGLAMLRLMPEHAEAVWHGSFYEGKRRPHEKLGAVEQAAADWEDRTWDAMKELAVKATNIVNLAIAHRWWRNSEAGDAEGDWQEYWTEPEALADRLVSRVLALAGIPAEVCTVQAYIDTRWGKR